MSENKKTDKFVEFIFSNDPRKYVILLFIIGFILRLVFSLQIGFGADEMGYAAHSIGFIDSGKLQIHDQDGVWFFVTDLFMKLLGYNVLGLRFFSALTGSFLIILAYLIGGEIFNRKVGLYAAFATAFSSYGIIMTTGVMDVPMSFFAFLSIYLLILFLKSSKYYLFVLSWVTLGVAIMIKQIAILFIPAFVIFTLYYNKKHHHSFRLQQVLYAAVIVIFMVTPVLTYNYLLYKDKGLVDLQFSRFFGIAEEHYASIANTLNPFSLRTLFISHGGGTPGFVQSLNFLIFFESWVSLAFAALGLFIFIRSKNKFRLLLILAFLFPFIFLAGTSILTNHFIFMSFFASLFAGSGLHFTSIKFEGEKKRKIFLIIVALLIILFSFIQIMQSTQGQVGKNEIVQLIDFKDSSIEQDSLVVIDSRIYRGRIAFMFWDRHYLETNYFVDLLENSDKLPGELSPVNVYFVEAVTDDSGWGSISSQPELNASTEEIVTFFSSQAKVIKTVNDLKGEPHFRVYSGTFNLKPSVLQLADSTHSFFFYPVAYKPASENFDNYLVYTSFDNLINKIAHLILYLEVLLTFILLIYIVYLLYKEDLV